MKKKQTDEGIKVKGMFRLKINEDGKVVGDSGWTNNQITNLGFQQYLVMSLGSISGSKYISHISLATGTIPASNATALTGELQKRTTVTASSTVAGSKTLRLTGSFASSASYNTANATIQSIGLFNTSSGGTLFAGNTFATSGLGTNQSVSFTYDIVFA